jgi:hypothetical protein
MTRHPIARIAAVAAAITALAAPSALAQDLSSPDARDAAAGRGTFNAPAVTVLKVAQDPAQPAGGIDWGDVGIGAGAALGIIAVGAGGASLLARRPRSRAAVR